jgi:predicted transcriptional regulator of viral defense system
METISEYGRPKLQAATYSKELLAEQYLLKNISKLYPEYTIAEERLSEGISPDFCLKDKEGNDLFVEVKATKIDTKYLGKIVDFYSAISNRDRQRKDSRPNFVLVGEKLDPNIKGYLDSLNIKFTSLNKLGFSYEKMRSEERNRRLRMLTPTEAKLVLDWEAKRQKSVTIDTLAEKTGGNRNYASKLLRRLERKEWLSRISSGVYGFIPASYGYKERFPPMNPFLIGSELVEPYYFAYSTATSHYGFSTQLPSTYFIVTTKKRLPYEWYNTRFRFITLSNRKFFGFRETEIFGVKVKIADPEKCLIDAVDKMHYCGGAEEVASVIYRGLKQADEPKLIDYLTKMNSYTLNQRFGFLMDFLSRRRLITFPSRLRFHLQENLGKAPIYLDAKRPRHGGYVREWNIVQNVPENELLSEIR